VYGPCGQPARYSFVNWLFNLQIDDEELCLLVGDFNLYRSEGNSVRHGYPWVPTDQAHGRPRRVGPAYQKTRRPVSEPNRPSWQPT
jgi:hypothetical protein